MDGKKKLKECYLYEKLKNKSCRCLACRFKCVISPGNYSRCRAKVNIAGGLYSLNYGLLSGYVAESTENTSPFIRPGGRNVFALSSHSCNFNCSWCRNKAIFNNDNFLRFQHEPTKDYNLDGESDIYYPRPAEVLPEQLITVEQDIIGFNLSEPAVCLEYAYDTGVLAKQKGKQVELHTNGYMTREAWDFMAPVVDYIGISVKCCGNVDFYQQNQADPRNVIDSIKHVATLGPHIDLFVIVNGGERQAIMNEVFDIAAEHDINITFIPLRTFKSPDVLEKEADNETLVNIYKEAQSRGAWAHLFGAVFDQQRGLLDFNTICPECDSLLATREIVITDFGRGQAHFETDYYSGDYCSCGRRIPWVTVEEVNKCYKCEVPRCKRAKG